MGIPSPTAARVVIADGEAPARRGARLALEQAGFVVVAEAGDRAQLVTVTLAEHPDLCLVAASLPGGAIPAIKTITAREPEISTVLFAARADSAELLAGVRAGAAGYLVNTIDPRRLPIALRGVLAGEAAIPRGLVQALVDEIRDREGHQRWAATGERSRVTDREWEVVDLLREEVPTREIAARLGISAVTVRRHISDVVRKLHASDRQSALRMLSQPPSRRRPGASR